MRRTPSKSAGRRGGFTLVELLVAAALTVLVMAILATAFQTGMQTLSQLKSVVGLSEHLRSVETVILRDLSAPHLENEQGVTVRVSEVGTRRQPAPWGGSGYFLVEHQIPTSATSVFSFTKEGDEDGVDSHRVTNQSLRFTIKRGGATVDDIFTANARLSSSNDLEALRALSRKDYAPDPDLPNPPNPTFAGEWAEVGYFLEQSAIQTQDEAGGSGFPLYTLRRRQRVLAPGDAAELLTGSETPQTKADEYPEVSFNPNVSMRPPLPATQMPYAVVSTPASVASISNRMLFAFIPTTNALGGSDILLTNVVSMQVLVQAYAPSNPDYTPSNPDYVSNGFLPVIPGAATPRRIDTADAKDMNYTTPREKPVLRAVQIKIRVYDTKNRVTRQVTFTQDL